jgi:hypothetical protein
MRRIAEINFIRGRVEKKVALGLVTILARGKFNHFCFRFYPFDEEARCMVAERNPEREAKEVSVIVLLASELGQTQSRQSR